MKQYRGMALGLILCGISLFCLDAVFGAVCPLKILTGFPCPGCGLTRAGLLFLQGRFGASFHMHGFFILGLVFLGFAVFLKKVLKKNSIFMNRYAIIILVLFLAYYGYRMYLYFPDTEPLIYWEDSWLKRACLFLGR